jgi:hypothetical protein
MDQHREPSRGLRRRRTSAAKPWHEPEHAPRTIGRFVELRPPRFVPGNQMQQEAALSALVELLTARLEKAAAAAATSPTALDFPPPSRCPPPSEPAQEETCP